MKMRYLALLCMAGLFVAGNTLGQDQGLGKNDGSEVLKHGDKKSVMRGGGDRNFPGGDGADMMGGEAIMHEMILGKILGNPKAVSEIGLSEEQIKTLKDSMEEMKKQHESFQKQLKEAGLEQAKKMMGDSVDEAAIMAAVEKAGNIRIEMAKARIKHMLLVKKTLKPEQIAKIREMVQHHMKQIRSERGKLGVKGKDESESMSFKDRLRERQRKIQPEESKDVKKNDSGKPAGSL